MVQVQVTVSSVNTDVQKTIQQLLRRFDVSFESGLTTNEVHSRREDVGYYNTVPPPIQCPAWICCLLPCIRYVPSMKLYQQIQPEDAEVRRNNGRYVRYDASTLVCGDIIRIEEGDVIPADCIVLQLLEGKSDELLVDHRYITGDEKPVSVKRNKNILSSSVDGAASSCFNVDTISTIYWGGRVVLGSALAICVAVGPNTYVSKLIQAKQFPQTIRSTTPSDGVDIISDDDGDCNTGVALLRQNSRDCSSRIV
jgi:E1-E2 ATPase/Cation transporter/ATPase, N-terminus